jgi:hypothetical protein
VIGEFLRGDPTRNQPGDSSQYRTSSSTSSSVADGFRERKAPSSRKPMLTGSDIDGLFTKFVYTENLIIYSSSESWVNGSSSFTTASHPHHLAQHSGVRPWLSLESGSTPSFASSILTTASYPFSAANDSGVCPRVWVDPVLHEQ